MAVLQFRTIYRNTFAVVLFLSGIASAHAEMSPDGVEVVPLYLSDQGNGILRYEDASGGTDEYTAAVGGLSDDTTRPFEVMGALGGPWTGPRISVCIEFVDKHRTMDGHLAFELYNATQGKSILRFRPVFDAEKAEAILLESEGAGRGECSRKYAP